MEKKSNITVWEAACIITGYGIGGGVLAMPYLAEQNGIFVSLLILVVAFAASYILHLMIADVANKCGDGTQIVSIFSKFLFRGKAKNILTVVFFVLMAIVLCTNLAAYISGAADVLIEMIPMPTIVAQIIFYLLAASVVIFGLKAVAVSEKIMVAVIFGLIAVLAIASFMSDLHELPFVMGTGKAALAYFGMAMFSFSAFFSIPQAVEGLAGDVKKIKKAILLGLGNNFILIVIITLCALLSSTQVTEVAMIGWSQGLGQWAIIVGGVFTLVAMLTTYWSISLALAGIVEEQFKLNSKLCWLFATLPSFILATVLMSGFLDFLQLAGGAIAIIVAVMVIPAFRNAYKEVPGSMLGNMGKTWVQILIIIAYILMAVGSAM